MKLLEITGCRKFEVIEAFKDKDIHLPYRSTAKSAGYDFEAAEDTTILPIAEAGKPTLVATGIKADMPSDEYLLIANRSSNPIKRTLVLANGIGVVDADYYNNPSNEGHIMLQFINYSSEPVVIKKGDKIGQGIFTKFGLVDNDHATGKRLGGHGSTGN